MNYTTRSDFPAELPSKQTFYCWHCRKPNTVEKQGKDIISYACSSCGQSAERVLIFDPKMAMTFDEQNQLVHESCGVFIVRTDGKLLLFQRTKFPYLLTIPAGHLEVGEDPQECAIRETEEEVGIKPKDITEVFNGRIEGESCLGGADIHNWHAYRYVVGNDEKINLDEEGSAWGWYEIDELNEENTVQPVIYLLNQKEVIDELKAK